MIRGPLLTFRAACVVAAIAISATVAGLAFLTAGCSRDSTGSLHANLRPEVRVVRGPIVGGTQVPLVNEIHWVGWDRDGVIDHYQFAFDLPESLSLEQINDPLNAARIAWRDTTVTEARFLLRTADPETVLGPDGSKQPTDRLLGHHTFYVRAVDDGAAVSDVDYVSFTVTNVMPRTTLITPYRPSPFASIGTHIYISWKGEDIDKPTGDLQPVAYEYKLIPLDNVLAHGDPQYAIDVSPGPQYPWVRLPGSTNELRLEFEASQDYWFAIRAIDVAGGVENRFITGQNCFKMSTSARNYDRPVLKVKEASLGTYVFPTDGRQIEGTIYLDRCLQFEFSADLSLYGGTLSGFNIGLDVPDEEDFSIESGYTGWTMIQHTLSPICFKTPGVHTVTIVARDTGGGMTFGRFVIRTLALPVRDRDLLFVDDFWQTSAGGSVDRDMDARARDMLHAAGYDDSEIHYLDPWGPGDIYGTAQAVTRADIMRYRTIVWNINGAGASGNGRTAFLGVGACGKDRWLRSFLQYGGALWIYGLRTTFSLHTSSSSSSCNADFTPRETAGVSFRADDFPCALMNMCGGDYRQVTTGTSKINGLIRAVPAWKGAADGLPTLEPDSTTYPYAAVGGLAPVDVQWEPSFETSGGLDTLYTMTAVTRNSPFNRKPIAWRYADPDPVPAHGPVVLFGVSLYNFKVGSAEQGTGVHGLARSVLAWMHRHQSNTPGVDSSE